MESSNEEAVVESYHHGLEVNGLVVARDGDPTVVTLSDRLRPDGAGFGVAIAHVYPSTLFGDRLEEAERVARHVVRALGIKDSVVYPQMLATEDEVLLIEVAARVPAGQQLPSGAAGGGRRSSRGRAEAGARRAGTGRLHRPPVRAAARDLVSRPPSRARSPSGVSGP